MAGASKGARGPITAINVTPLVDVMLVLLAIFMLTARLADEARALPLDLPRAASGEVTQTVLRIRIDAAGQRHANGARVADDGALVRLARRMRSEQPELRTVIEAARQTHHGHVIGTLDALRLAGLSRVAFAVEPAADANSSQPMGTRPIDIKPVNAVATDPDASGADAIRPGASGANTPRRQPR